ncbi:putative thermolabile L-asparaginase [Bisporella sp. PMI_857]|nr:putative thermolabile L-asparaginase [Bisporella sp. PMI_857]
MITCGIGDDFVIEERSGIIENRHVVHAAVVDVNGSLLYAVGDPFRLTLARSAAKPGQALAILETIDQKLFDESDIALMCASHSSEARHVNQARVMLEKTGAQESDLVCGGHPSISQTITHGWIERGFTPISVYNNCSGKHAGMLAGAKTLVNDFAGYHLQDHPMQVKVKKVFEELCEPHAKELRWAWDGCNLPTPAMPLHVLAKIYAGFAQAADLDTSKVDSHIPTRTQLCGHIFQAMVNYPELVGGEQRFCTELMKALQAKAMTKLGADGCYAIGVRSTDDNGPIGIAVKIEDGNIGSILHSAVMEILEQLQLVTQVQRAKLSDFEGRQICNTAGVDIGRVIPQFKVRSIDHQPERTEVI